MPILFTILLILTFGLIAQETELEPPSPAIQPREEESIAQDNDNAIVLQQPILKAVLEQTPGIDENELLEFCHDVAPDMLDEWKRLCREQPDKAKNYLELLVKRFLKAKNLLERDEADYERYLNQLKNETQIRTLSRQIQLLDVDDKSTYEERVLLKLKLAALMEQSFDDAQIQQQVEINRLENEVRNLRSLAEERAANKINILRQRFLLLTGEEWP